MKESLSRVHLERERVMKGKPGRCLHRRTCRVKVLRKEREKGPFGLLLLLLFLGNFILATQEIFWGLCFTRGLSVRERN